jgi:hypothetical protein
MRAQRAAFIGIAILALSFWFTGIPREIVPYAYSEFVRMHSDSVYATLLLLIYLGMMIRSPGSWGIAQAGHAQIDRGSIEREPLHATGSS